MDTKLINIDVEGLLEKIIVTAIPQDHNQPQSYLLIFQQRILIDSKDGIFDFSRSNLIFDIVKNATIGPNEPEVDNRINYLNSHRIFLEAFKIQITNILLSSEIETVYYGYFIRNGVEYGDHKEWERGEKRKIYV